MDEVNCLCFREFCSVDHHSICSSLFARGVWPLRGIRIGEASHPGPPRSMQLYAEEEDLENALHDSIELATQTVQSLIAHGDGLGDHMDDSTQRASANSPDATLYVGPPFEFVPGGSDGDAAEPLDDLYGNEADIAAEFARPVIYDGSGAVPAPAALPPPPVLRKAISA